MAILLWRVSVVLYKRGWRWPARALKALNFFLFKNLLPFQATMGRDIVLGHHGLGTVIHPNVSIGNRVTIWHNVTVAAETTPGSPYRVYIGDDVEIGAGAVIVARKDAGLRVGAGAKIGANAVVTKDVAAGAVVVGAPARAVHGTRHLPVGGSQGSDV